jgi:aspartyl-tRNA(Asn)/glutamyl-tRNA(Gln) amidotransferase subunit A
MTHDDLAFSDIVALQRLLTARTISSVELTELYLKRLEQHGHVFNAVVTILHDRARREAKRADAERARGRVRGPLHGIPYGVKDLLATPDAPTTWGAQPYRQQRFGFDATVVKKLTDAGAVLLAKLAMVELAGGFGYGDADASFTGPGRTPWNANFWSGGSSSGSGIAVSAALVGFAIGSETSGSILFPATACGITGLRPTYGRVSRHGAMALCWTLDKLGPMARSARDTDLILRVIAGADPDDPTAVDAPFAPPRRKLRVAVLKDATKASMPEVAANFRASLKAIGTFADVAGEVALPKGPWGPVVGTIVDAEGAAAFRDLIESGRARELRDPDDKLGGYVAYATPAVDYIDALRQRAKLNAALVKAMHGYDAVVSPTLPTVTYPIGLGFDKAYPKYPGGPSLISPGNLAGLPALALPNGMGPNGLPTSLTFLGHAWGEAALTALGSRYQRETAFHTKRPPIVTARKSASN